jgi:hypothetical protein
LNFCGKEDICVIVVDPVWVTDPNASIRGEGHRAQFISVASLNTGVGDTCASFFPGSGKDVVLKNDLLGCWGFSKSTVGCRLSPYR